ncbi:digestive cysteine proteinase 1-like isoform X1 [Scyliorhinus canicula]|uniref:digestive cysteine proteinase 1-like isoform X1 n=1 Tax=Scyliorhinus canicula TaxID=7830 RepID=UPI0018F4DBAB|nr:digestive cysteine proteinase 1-like isoform X1 [Scyliorhinus canicula]
MLTLAQMFSCRHLTHFIPEHQIKQCLHSSWAKNMECSHLIPDNCLTLANVKPLHVPTFPNIYHISGILSLPYAEIEEPFEAWYSETGEVSRIDYYDGQVITVQCEFQKPDGISYKISPETTETETNVMKCFQINGTIFDPVYAQPVIPNLHGFQFIKEDDYKGIHCSVWHNYTAIGKKENTYTMWIADSKDGPIPVHYEMKGFNTLFGGHYDKYEIDYNELMHYVDPNVFTVFEGLSCESFPGNGAEHRILANPIQDFIDNSMDNRTHNMFQEYKKQFNRDYEKDEKEHEIRKATFTHNMRYIHSMNRKLMSYRMEINHFTDRSVDEMSILNGRRRSTTPNKGQPFPTELYKSIVPPPSVDWRLYGAVTHVKDQAMCGSCWTFSSTGNIEGALFLKTGYLVHLSQQALIDCTWGFGNAACDGGEEWRAFEWMLKHGGIPTAESYGSYLGQNGFCHYNQSVFTAELEGYVNVTSGDMEALKIAIFKNGPVSVGMDASHKTFRFYSDGVYYDPNCRNARTDLDHAVLAVGYGTLAGQPYWLIKNSWSTIWGDDGYVLMSMEDNNCGITTDPLYVILI